MSFSSERKAHRNHGGGAICTCVEKWVYVVQGLDYDIHENEPYRPPTLRRVMDQGPKLLPSDIHCPDYAKVLPPMGCLQPVTVCGRNSNASLFQMAHLGSRTLAHLAKHFLDHTGVWNASPKPSLPLSGGQICIMI